MVVFSTRRRLLVALAFCSAAALASPASARSHHGASRHLHAHDAARHFQRHDALRRHRRLAHAEGFERRAALSRLRRFGDTQASVMPGAFQSGQAMSSSASSSSLVNEARRYLGTNPTRRATLWCARFMNMVLQRTGHRGTGSDMASSFAHYGERVSGPRVGAIAVMSRRGGGHVGIITGIDAQGDPIMISGNNRNRVRETPVSRNRIYAYVMPD